MLTETADNSSPFGVKSANPHPILGTEKEKALKKLRAKRIAENNGVDPYEAAGPHMASLLGRRHEQPMV